MIPDWLAVALFLTACGSVLVVAVRDIIRNAREDVTRGKARRAK